MEGTNTVLEASAVASERLISKNLIFQMNKSKLSLSKNPIFQMNKFKLFFSKNSIFEMNKSKLFILKNPIFEMNKSKWFISKNPIFEMNKSKLFILKNPIFEMNKCKLFISKHPIFEINKSKLKNPIFEITGSPKNLSVLRAAAGLGSWCLARPAGRMANIALLWAEILAITAAMFPMVALRMPRGSASGQAMMVLDLMVSWKEESMQSTVQTVWEDGRLGVFFGGNKH